MELGKCGMRSGSSGLFQNHDIMAPSVSGWRVGGRANNVLSQTLGLQIRNNLERLSMVPDNKTLFFKT